MAEPARKPTTTPYDVDFYAWSQEQARLLKMGSSAGLDWEKLAEEIRTLGGSERSEIRSRLVVLLTHLLKWEYQPSKRKAGWRASILEARDQIDFRLADSPSLRSYPSTVLDKQYRIARLRAADETDMPIETFPEKCPYTIADALNEDFLPGEKP